MWVYKIYGWGSGAGDEWCTAVYEWSPYNIDDDYEWMIEHDYVLVCPD